MTQSDDMRGKVMHHLRMFALAVFGGFAFILTLIFVVYVLFALGVIHMAPDH